MYIEVKYTHIALALISINLFVFRAALNIMQAPLKEKLWLRIAPHVNDSLLLATAIYLMLLTSQYPFAVAWLTIKICAVVAYIVLGSIALKKAKTTAAKLLFSLLAIGMFAVIGSIALFRS